MTHTPVVSLKHLLMTHRHHPIFITEVSFKENKSVISGLFSAQWILSAEGQPQPLLASHTSRFQHT